MTTQRQVKEFVTLRVPRVLADEVRRLAAAESETQSTVFRRLLRRGLQIERRSSEAEATS